MSTVPEANDKPVTSTGAWAGAESSDAGLAPSPGVSAPAVVPVGMPASHGFAVAGTVNRTTLAPFADRDEMIEDSADSKNRVVSFMAVSSMLSIN